MEVDVETRRTEAGMQPRSTERGAGDQKKICEKSPSETGVGKSDELTGGGGGSQEKKKKEKK